MAFFKLASQLRMELAEIQHKHNLEIQEKDAAFQRERKMWDEDKGRLESQLKKDHELKMKEVVTLTKLDSEQRVKQIELDSQRKIDELRNKNIQELAEAKVRLTEEHYEKLNQALVKLHSEGDKNTKFTQELALKMFESAPKHTVRTEQLTGSIDATIKK